MKCDVMSCENERVEGKYFCKEHLIDEKLKEAMITYRIKVEKGIDTYKDEALAIAQIKQALADERYTPPVKIKAFRDKTPFIDSGLRTGSEWYERFEKELEDDNSDIPYGKSVLEVMGWFHERVLEAAKKAGGL